MSEEDFAERKVDCAFQMRKGVMSDGVEINILLLYKDVSKYI
jgi:hypothetical protein